MSTRPVTAMASRKAGERPSSLEPGLVSWRAITTAPLTYALTAPTVSTTAAAAAAMLPAGPIATLSKSASGTVVPGPSTLTVAMANPRYRAVVTARAIAITLGSCLEGLANRVVSGATASQPTNDSIRVVAAWPTESQPCGANGLQRSICAYRPDPMTETATTVISKATSTSCAPALARSPAAERPSTIRS